MMHSSGRSRARTAGLLALLGLVTLAAPALAAPGAPAPLQLTTGKTPPRATILFLHGLGGRPDRNDLLQRLVRGFERRGESYRVVAPWLRPMKRGLLGPRDGGAQTMSFGVEQVKRALEGIDGPVVVVGHSMGGLLGLYCQKLPELEGKIQATVCFAPSVSMLKASWKKLGNERELPAPSEENLAHLRRTYDGAIAGLERETRPLARLLRPARAARARGERDYLRTMRDLIGWEPRLGSIPRVTAPTLLIYGDGDTAVSPHYLDRLANREQNPGVTAIRLEGVDHGFWAGRQVTVAGKEQRIVDPLQTEKMTGRLCASISEFASRHALGKP